MNPIQFYFILVSLFCFNPSFSQEKKEKLNVLFIIADDLNCSIGAYGDKQAQTPHIDKLAQKGVLFGNAHNQYPLCGPSRVSMMTGLYPDQTNSKRNRLYVRQTLPDVITMGQKFRQEKYHSVRVGKIYHYHNPRDIGTAGHDDTFTWDQTVNPYGRDKHEESKLHKLKPKFDGGTLSWMSSDGEDAEQTDGIGASETIAFLKRFAKSKEPFFMAYGLYRPHVPFVAPHHYFDLYKQTDFEIPEYTDATLAALPKGAALTLRAKKEQKNIPLPLAKEIKEAYYATTSFVDAQVGRVLDALKETGLDKNTIVVFTSDHGYHLGEKGHWQKQTLFEQGTRIPMIVAGPGIHSNTQKWKAPVELVDVYPTLMELVGMKTPEFVSGRSFAPLLLTDQKRVRHSALTELNVRKKNYKAHGYALKTDRYRLNQWKDKDGFSYELYDHKFDPAENKNLAEDSSYKKQKDSLITVLQSRIIEAQKVPNGLGKQIKGVQPIADPKNNYSYSK